LAGERRNTRTREQIKLATYLGAQTAHRFRRKGRLTTTQQSWRVRLFVVAGVLGFICLWSVWREFF
jgi:hypothetical protein